MQIGDLDDSLAVAQGKVIRDTLLVSVYDSLFGKKYPVDSIKFVPFTGGKNLILVPERLQPVRVLR
jgi:hypothetical protein